MRGVPLQRRVERRGGHPSVLMSTGDEGEECPPPWRNPQRAGEDRERSGRGSPPRARSPGTERVTVTVLTDGNRQRADSTASASTWWVLGKKSCNSRAVSSYRSDSARTSRASVDGLQET